LEPAQSAQSAHLPQEIYTIEELLDAFKMNRMSKAAGPQGRRAAGPEGDRAAGPQGRRAYAKQG